MCKESIKFLIMDKTKVEKKISSLIEQLGNSYAENIKGKTMQEANLLDFGIMQELSTLFATERILNAIKK